MNSKCKLLTMNNFQINYLTPWLSIENKELRARSLVKSMMCSCFIANSRHRTTRPSGEKNGCKMLATSCCTWTWNQSQT